MNELYEASLRADKEGSITQWMVDFLNSSGRNPKLAEGLEADGHFPTPIIDYPIAKFKVLLGPDRSFLYYEEPEEFNARVAAMVEALDNGWKPVPFIVTDIWNEELELSDGAHRAEALKRAGIESYPTVFFFKSKQAREEFLETL